MDVLKVVRRSRLVFPLACVAVATMVLFSEIAQRQAVRTLSEMGSVLATRVAIRNLQQAIVDAESGQRGMMISGLQDYRLQYEQAILRMGTGFQELDRRYVDHAESRELMAQLHKVAESRLSELALTLRLKDAGRSEAGTAIMASGIGREKLDEFRRLSNALLDRETANTARSQNDIYRTLLISRIGIALFSLVGLVSMYLYLRQTAALERQQHAQQDLLQLERDRLEVEVTQRTTELTELALHLQTVREDERQRLARNLHDDLGSLLTSAKLDAARIRSRLSGSAPESLELLKHLVATLNDSIALGRRIIEDLRPSALENLGLVATLEILLREFASHSDTQVHTALEAVALPSASEMIVYRVVQEAITNITKYAGASQVWVDLGPVNGRAQVSVRDDGAGFDKRTKPDSAFGLIAMRFRVEAVGGTLITQAALGQGTRIVATLPLLDPLPA
ncbi:MAG: CHASE3 domain-containing protein [Rhodoferax sp.]|nr:CHASE3 domain-containing protein [Rhodoferax sp.]